MSLAPTLVIDREYLLPTGVRVRLEGISPLSGGIEHQCLLSLRILSGAKSGEATSIIWPDIRLRTARNSKPTCRCTAYSFPHHRGFGRCREEK